MKKRYWWIAAIIVLFVGINVYLVAADNHQKVDRIAYVNDWTAIEKKDLHESYQSAGVVRYANESDVYFDKDLGNFKEFIVNEGQEVHTGDPLYSYYAKDFYETQAMLQQKRDLLDDEIRAIDTAINKVQSFQTSSGASTSTSGNLPSTGKKTKDAALQTEIANLQRQITSSDSKQADMLKTQYIAEKEKERDQKKAEQQSVQSQIAELSSSGDTITVESPFSGRVTKLSKELKAPLMTIQDSDALQVAGEITEKQRLHTEEGMKTAITMQKSGEKLEGEISQLSNEPIDLQVKGSSLYPFAVDLPADEKTDKLLPGYHAKLEIFTKTVPDAVTAKEEAVVSNHLWVMNHKGKLAKQKAKIGIAENGYIEIKNPLQPGNWLAVAPKRDLRNNATFITPLEITKIRWKGLQTDKKSNLQHFVTGILSR